MSVARAGALPLILLLLAPSLALGGPPSPTPSRPARESSAPRRLTPPLDAPERAEQMDRESRVESALNVGMAHLQNRLEARKRLGSWVSLDRAASEMRMGRPVMTPGFSDWSEAEAGSVRAALSDPGLCQTLNERAGILFGRGSGAEARPESARALCVAEQGAFAAYFLQPEAELRALGEAMEEAQEGDEGAN